MTMTTTSPSDTTDPQQAACVVAGAWCEGLRPDASMTVSTWADRYRILSNKASAEAGRWRTDRTPYLREIMDHLSTTSPVQRIVFMKGAQTGGTEAGCNLIGYVIHQAPGPILAIAPTVDMAKRYSKQRIEPQINESPVLRQRVAPARSRDAGNTMLSKEFPGGVLLMTGANSAVGLRSMPARYIFMDEIDGYPGDVDGEGDPILLAERRSVTFGHRRKMFLVSTPTLKDTSRIQREFSQSDQRYYLVPCPYCQHQQALVFSQLFWPKSKPSEAKYRCVKCEKLIDEHHKTKMLAKGQWQPSNNHPVSPHTRGYHLSSLYSPIGWFSWGDAASMYEEAQQHTELMKGFVNTVLGEPFEEACEAPEWERLYERRNDYPIGTVPEGGLFLTAGVDIQRDRIECEVVAWGRNKISWSVDYQIFDGDTAQAAVWKKLDELLAKDWPHANGSTMPIRVLAIDSGYATQEVYSWVRQHPQAAWGATGARASQPRTVVAVKGRDRDTALILGVSKADTGGKRQGLRVWGVSSPVAKVELYRWLKLPRVVDTKTTDVELSDDKKQNNQAEESPQMPAGSCFFPPYNEEYFKQLTAEKRVTRLHKGFPKVTWEKDPSRRNEALDCRVYARAAASIYGLDRFKESHWQRLEQTLAEQPKSCHVTSTDPNNQPKKRYKDMTWKERMALWYRPPMYADHPYLPKPPTPRNPYLD
jgi:phage terminase large subunit GpA-like protein